MDGVHDVGADRVDVGREVDEVVPGQSAEAKLVSEHVGQGWCRRSLGEQGTERFSLVETEGGDATTVGPSWKSST
jgi:hypothetical protein